MPGLHRRQLLGLGLGSLLAGAGCGSQGPRITARQAAALAPTGWLRVCINLGDPLLARRVAAGAPVTGVSVDLAQALAARLGVEALLRVVDSAQQAVDMMRVGDADIGFLAIDPQRTEGITFSAPYLLVESASLLRHESLLTDRAQVDHPGTRLQADAERLPGSRLLPGRFVLIEQALCLPAGRGADAAAALHLFVEQAKASGLVAQSLVRHGIQGTRVAAPG